MKKMQHPSKKTELKATIYPISRFIHGLPEMTLSKINELTGLR